MNQAVKAAFDTTVRPEVTPFFDEPTNTLSYVVRDPASKACAVVDCVMGPATGIAHYNGYGSCPLTVERGKIVLAEFGYGGKLLPSFPQWVINGQQPSRLAWILKEKILPPIYWKAMLKGKEWMVNPQQNKTGTTTD